MTLPAGTARVAVVVPCRNAAAWLPALLDSIAAQTYPPAEVVVVDDGSTDRSADVVARWIAEAQLPGFRVIKQEAQGVASAIRRGMAETAEAYVVRIDADDVVAPEFLEELHRALEDHPDAGYAYPAMRMFGTASGRYPVRAFDPAHLVIAGNFVCSGALMRRSAYEESGGIADLPAWEDWDLWLRFLEHGYRGVFVDKELYFWRRHGPSRNTLPWLRRRVLRLRIWFRHRGLVGRYLLPGMPVLAHRALHRVKQQ